jgi:hypothetical protein
MEVLAIYLHAQLRRGWGVKRTQRERVLAMDSPCLEYRVRIRIGAEEAL